MPIKKKWLSIEEFEKIQGGDWTPEDHAHVKVDITDTPWAWADVSKTGSNLTDLATRQHAGLTNVTSDLHHAQSHTLASHSSKAHSELTGVTSDLHHPQSHTLVSHTARDHHHLVGLGDDDHSQYHNNARGDARYYTKTQLQTSGQSQVHWGNITNEPSFYPPEYHYHVGKDIVSLHLVDLNDVEADDIFDVLNTAAIHGQGNYDWFGTWVTTATNGSAEIAVLSGADKMLRITHNGAGSSVKTVLNTDSGHEIISGVLEFQARNSVTDKPSYFGLWKDAQIFLRINFSNTGKIRFSGGDTTEVDIQNYSANTWYKIRIHFDAGAGYAIIWVDNVFKNRYAVDFSSGYYANKIQINCTAPSAYTFDINNLKIFQLTI